MGYYSTDDTAYGYLLSDGTFTTINVPGSMFTIANGINDLGQIVGVGQSQGGARAFLLTPPREDGAWYPGDIVAYRCEDCMDRWDIVLDEDDASGDFDD